MTPDEKAVFASAVLDAAEVFEQQTGHKPTHVQMSAVDAAKLGVRGEPVQQIPVDVNGIRWWATLPPKATP